MNFNIPKEKKIETLNNLISDCESQVYRYALSCGIDPDTLSEDWVRPEVASNDSPVYDLERELNRLGMLKSKLGALK